MWRPQRLSGLRVSSKTPLVPVGCWVERCLGYTQFAMFVRKTIADTPDIVTYSWYIGHTGVSASGHQKAMPLWWIFVG